MGGTTCREQKTNIEDPLAWTYDSDPHFKGVKHSADLTCSNKEMQKLIDPYVDKLKADQTLYKDSTMPTDPIILKSKTAEIKCSYERPSTFLYNAQKGRPYEVIDLADVHPNQIEVGDEVMQYFGVFLCFLADRPHLIQKIITTEPNTYGMHGIQAYREGRITDFLIDDYILCKEKKPVFTQPCKGRYMWPCLIEKAWLKIRGNSAKRVEQTSPEELFQTFMPLPIEKKHLNEIDSLDQKAKLFKLFGDQHDSKGYIFTSKKNPEHDMGLSGRRHFYLMGSFIYEGRRLFYLRNPCGDMAFRGIYADLPEPLHDMIREKYGKVLAGDFVIEEDELLEQMSEIMTIHQMKDYKITSAGFKSSNTEQFFVGFNLKSKGNLSLRVSQFAAHLTKNQHMYPLMYHVVRLSDMRLIGGMDNKQGCFGLKSCYILDNFFHEADQGKYLIRLKKKQYQHSLPEIHTYLMGYFRTNIQFDIMVQEEMNQKWKEFLVAESKRHLANSQHRGINPDIAHVVCWLGDLVVVYVENVNKKRKQVSVEVNFPQLMNLECISHPELSRSSEWRTYTVKDNLLFIFQKIDLTGQTHIRQYHLESF